MSLARRFTKEPATVYHMTAEQRLCIQALRRAERWVATAQSNVREGVCEAAVVASAIDVAIEALNAAKEQCNGSGTTATG